MRVLITGSNATQNGSTRTQTNFFGITHALKRALEDLGHEVTQRVPDPENDIKMVDHDIIFAGVACIATLGGRYSQDIYYMIGQWNKSPFPMICFADDWHMDSLQSTVAGILKEP